MMCNTSYFFAFGLLLGVIVGSSGEIGVKCDISSVNSRGACGENERCVSKTNTTYTCACTRNSAETNGKCVEISTTAAASIDPNSQRGDEKSSGSSLVVGLLVPTFLIFLGGLGFCIARRYRLLPCHRNRYGNVLVTRDEDDDDDPPIA